MLRQVELSVGQLPDPLWKRPPGRPRTNGPTNSVVTTTFPLRLCGGKPPVAVTRERRYGPSRLRVNDDDDDDDDDDDAVSVTLLNALPLLVRDQSLTLTQFCVLLKTVLFCKA